MLDLKLTLSCILSTVKERHNKNDKFCAVKSTFNTSIGETMNPEFWLEKWNKNDIGFHVNEVNPMLAKHSDALSLHTNNRVFLPLCGKTNDIYWLVQQGYQVVGIELIETAVEQLFSEMGIQPQTSQADGLKLYQTTHIDIFVGDFFALTEQQLGMVNAVYDRAALVALPPEMRQRYTQHLTAISHRAPQLLITYAYDQNLRAGPPFSVDQEEVKRHYLDNYQVSLLESVEIPGGPKGNFMAHELIWLLE